MFLTLKIYTMKIKNLLSVIAIAVIALLSGCAKDDFVETIGVCPIVIETTPLNGAGSVPLHQIITATFNKEMNPLTINESSFVVTSGGIPISGVVTYSGVIATFTPNVPLSPNAIFTAKIKTSVKDITGNALQTDYVWIFTTGISPIIIATNPIDLAVSIPLDQIVTATFNKIMNPSTINQSSFTLATGGVPVVGTVSYTGVIATFTPTAILTANTVYTATITTVAKDVTGNALLANYVWTFTTSPSPIVVATDPLNNAIEVVLNKTITATFSMPMNPLTLTASTFTVKQGTTTIPGAISYSGTTVTFVPTNQLIDNKVYTCTITTGAKNVVGNPLANDYVWNFTTIIPVIVPPPPVATSGLFFGVFGGNAGITNQGLFTVVNGNLGTTAASSLITGFRDGTSGDVYTVTPLNNGLVTGEIYAAAPAPGSSVKAATALAGLNAARAAYLSISPASMPGGIDPGAGELGGLTLTPSIYKSNSGTFNITNGNLTLDAQGDPNAIFVFQCAAALTVGDSVPSSVILINGALAKNVYWYVGSAAVINYAGGGTMNGNIIANSGVTLSSPANSTNSNVTTLNGRAISLVAAVTMVNTVINVPN
jgi:Ice-binding-like/Bacterial Ig-like domain